MLVAVCSRCECSTGFALGWMRGKSVGHEVCILLSLGCKAPRRTQGLRFLLLRREAPQLDSRFEFHSRLDAKHLIWNQSLLFAPAWTQSFSVGVEVCFFALAWMQSTSVGIEDSFSLSLDAKHLSRNLGTSV